ncbi:MAG: hypothetical protein ACLGG0_04945 [Bacteriovoracia bacterium]
MSDQKKDLTRIEDLGEFLHELDETENYLDLPALPDDEESPPDLLPELPSEDFAMDAPPELSDVPEEVPLEEEVVSEEALFSNDFSTEETPTETEAFELSAEEPQTEPFELSPSNETEPEEQPIEFETVAEEQTVTEELEIQRPEPVQESLSSISLVHDFENFSKDVEPTEEEEKVEEPAEVFTPKEDFAETRRFAESAVINDASAECNPAYSVMAKNIRFLEDSEEILSLLKEAGFPDDMRAQFQRQIERGTLLVPRVSEFTAVYLCHKLRRFRLELTMALSDLMHPPKKAQDIDRGLVSRKSLGQNSQHQFQFKGDADSARSIILSTLPHLDGHAVDRYLGVASEHTFLDSQIVENETAEAIHKSYDELALKLKGHALHNKANAILGINYQLTPMPTDMGSMGHYRYKLTCTGNLVWLHKLTN